MVKPVAALLAGLALVALAQPAGAAGAGSRAAPYVWHSVKVGGGGFIPGIVFSRAERGLAYARSDMGGAYRWDALAKTWIPLEDGFAEGSYFGVEGLAPDPVDPNVVYAAVGVGAHAPAAMLRSKDRGDHWEVTPVPFHMGGNEDGRGLGERLAVDPNDTAILYFGSRFDGLQRSADHGRSWSRAAGFPLRGLGVPTIRRTTHGGVSFVLFDPGSGARSRATKTLFAGDVDPGPDHLFRSDDAGEHWHPIPGGPTADLLPVQAQIDARGVLYITYSNTLGPNGITRGAVFKLDTHTGGWTDITPDKTLATPAGGYMGLSLDRSRPGALVVATIDRFHPGDTIWRSLDGGQTWRDIRPLSRRDVAASPFLLWGKPEADFGWWMTALAIDPFDSDTITYATGATLYANHELTKIDRGRSITWTPWVEGIEQTAIITLNSPHDGPPLLSGFGDIGGFAHEDLATSPAAMFADPRFDNTDTLDVAGRASIVVRSGIGHNKIGPTLGLSQDYGRTWRPLVTPSPTGDAAITTSADGRTLTVMTPTPIVSRDLGRTWRSVVGAPTASRLVADRVNAERFYALDFDTAAVFASTDSAATFTRLPTHGLPSLTSDHPRSRESAWPLYATPDEAGDLWVTAKVGLFHSTDGGRSFVRASGDLAVEALSFGKAPAGHTYPALFAIGTRGDLRAIWRSDDQGASWVRVNDPAHEYGRRFRSISGDPRVFGRVYIGTDGRGVLYGQPAPRP